MPIKYEYYEKNTDPDAGTMRPTLFGNMLGGQSFMGTPKMAEVPTGWKHESTGATLWEFLSGKAQQLAGRYLYDLQQYGKGTDAFPKDPYPSRTEAIFKSGKIDYRGEY